MNPQIHVGTMSLLLLLGVLHGTIVALFLVRSKRNRIANTLLASLLLVSVLRLFPFAIGYAGFYDAYPWLSFAPWNLSLAFGPLAYLYLLRLTSREMPKRSWVHFVPVILQFLYFLFMFMQPLSVKEGWDDSKAGIAVAHALTFLTLASAIIYLCFAIKRYLSYQAWLQEGTSFADDLRRPLLRNILVAFTAFMTFWLVYAVADLVHPMSYVAVFPVYVVLTGFVYVLGMEGWRHAETDYPVMRPVVQALSNSPPQKDETNDPNRWRALGNDWLAEIKRRNLWRNPDLSVIVLAKEMGTNTTYLSRALNEGLGQSFNECINRLRVAAVCDRIRRDDDRDLLTIALEAGFRSKASFNRAFKAYQGVTPSEFRDAHLRTSASQITKSSCNVEDAAPGSS